MVKTRTELLQNNLVLRVGKDKRFDVSKVPGDKPVVEPGQNKFVFLTLKKLIDF